MPVPMGTPPASRDTNRAQRPNAPGPLRVRVEWPNDPPSLEQEAELIDRLFGDEIRKLFEDTS